jgi:GrpB-like predicted nucleotidyltransferase (UPF0157 family)
MTDRKRVEVEIANYDESWAEAFEEERELLVGVVGAYLVGSIEHVGSTSVAGLVAKPVVDIQAGVAGLEESRPVFGPLQAIGYTYDSVCPHVMHFFDKRVPGKQSYNLQLIPYRSDCWNMRIAFRDYLRSNPMVAQEYAALKLELARRFRLDRVAYGEGKGPFIRQIAERAAR